MAISSQQQSNFLTVNGLRLHYLDWGNSSAPPIVWIHGYTSCARAFNAPARHFQNHFRIIATDVRGHGDSEWSPVGAYRYSDQESDLEGLVDQLGLERFTLIGTSMGGVIAMSYAGAHPERLVGLVINDIGPDVETGSQRVTQGLGGRPKEFASLEDAMSYQRKATPNLAGLSEADQRELALGRVRRLMDGRWVWRMDPAYIQQRIQNGTQTRSELWAVLQRLPCPTLVVWAMESDILSETQARRMVEVLPKGELVAVPGVVHAPTLTEPAALAALKHFLEPAQDP